MPTDDFQTYYELYSKKYKKCKSKKDYKKLCKEMIYHYGVIDQIDANQWKIFSSLIGEDEYFKGIALAIKMYILESQGVECDIVSCENIFNDN